MEALDDKFGNPVNVSDSIISEFVKMNMKSKSDASKLVELHREVISLYNDLLAVGVEKQLSDNNYLLQVVIKKIPTRYAEELMRDRHEKTGKPGETLYKILTDFLKNKTRQFELYAPWELKEDKPDKDGKTCFKCHVSGHLSRDCPKGKSSRQSMNTLKIKNQQEFDNKKAEIGPCPVCNGHHTWRSKRDDFDRISDQLKDCPNFKAMSVDDRGRKLEEISGCVLCTSRAHQRDNCRRERRPCGIKDGNNVCQKLHGRLLHGSHVVYCNVINLQNHSQVGSTKIHDSLNDDDPADDISLVHMVKYVFPNFVPTVMFFDDGSTTSIITHKLAGFLGLKGKDVTQWIEVAGREYELSLIHI